MSEEKKKKTSKKKKEEQVIVEENFVKTEFQEEVKVEEEQVQSVEEEPVSLESIIEETISEELKEVEEEREEKFFQVSPIFTTEEKLFITKMIANGYRPFDIVKKARATLKLSEEKQRRLSLNIRTIEQLIKAMEA